MKESYCENYDRFNIVDTEFFIFMTCLVFKFFSRKNLFTSIKSYSVKKKLRCEKSWEVLGWITGKLQIVEIRNLQGYNSNK